MIENSTVHCQPIPMEHGTPLRGDVNLRTPHQPGRNVFISVLWAEALPALLSFLPTLLS